MEYNERGSYIDNDKILELSSQAKIKLSKSERELLIEDINSVILFCDSIFEIDDEEGELYETGHLVNVYRNDIIIDTEGQLVNSLSYVEEDGLCYFKLREKKE